MLSETYSDRSARYGRDQPVAASPLLGASAPQAALGRLRRSLEVWLAFAVVLLASWGTWESGAWLLAQWQLR